MERMLIKGPCNLSKLPSIVLSDTICLDENEMSSKVSKHPVHSVCHNVAACSDNFAIKGIGMRCH